MAFLVVILLLYCLANIYIGLRTFQWLKTIIQISPVLYWLLLGMTASSPVTSRLLSRTGLINTELISILGNWWLAILYWSALLWLTADIIRLTDTYLNFLPAATKSPLIQGFIVLIILSGILIYGAWNAVNPVITRYDVIIDKKAGSLSSLKVALVTDIHMGPIVNLNRVEKLTKIINDLKPDVVLYAGDIIDDDVKYVADNNITGPLRHIKPHLGSYAVLGNHEYIGGQPATAVELLETAGLQVLRDQWIKVADAFFIVGRDDMSITRYAGRNTTSLSEIMIGINKDYPVLLLDHQPGRIEEAERQGIDLQLSGHTHKGQFFPNDLITSRVYEQDWGYLKKGVYQLIVSCGYGTWGPPIRLGNSPEIVEITIHFR